VERGAYDADGFIGHADVGGLGVGLGEDGDRLDAETLARAHHAASDLTAIGHEHLIEELRCGTQIARRIVSS
jgi:hypothetical protein